LIRLGAILGGYAFALLLAWAAVALHALATEGSAHQASAGMTSFSDAVLFLGVMGLAALPPTVLAVRWALPWCCRLLSALIRRST